MGKMDAYRLFLEFLLGMVGTGYFLYGKKAGRYIFMVCGVGLGVFPYFVTRFVWIAVIGCLLLAIPFLLREN